MKCTYFIKTFVIYQFYPRAQNVLRVTCTQNTLNFHERKNTTGTFCSANNVLIRTHTLPLPPPPHPLPYLTSCLNCPDFRVPPVPREQRYVSRSLHVLHASGNICISNACRSQEYVSLMLRRCMRIVNART